VAEADRHVHRASARPDSERVRHVLGELETGRDLEAVDDDGDPADAMDREVAHRMPLLVPGGHVPVPAEAEHMVRVTR
jgi:hypothetical protein